ncbi:zinc transporter ZIP14 [Biomphalaria glabrata]|nr:zinc transporter ZIP14-like [Biomphalaria glabrata]
MIFMLILLFAAAVSSPLNSEYSSPNGAALQLVRRYAENRTTGSAAWGLSQEEFAVLLQQMTSHSAEYLDSLVGECKDIDGNCTWKIQCPGIPEIYSKLSADGVLSPDALIKALPVVLNTLSSENCSEVARETLFHVKQVSQPTAAEAWAWSYSIAFVTLINIISNFGAFLGPIMKRNFFKRLLQFLVAMGAGSLVTTGVVVLIPEAFDLMEIEELGDDYVWKGAAAILSIYVFFSLEKVLKTLRMRKQKPKIKRNISLHVEAPENETKLPLAGEKSSQEDHGHSHSDEGQSLAWMIMTGDAIHKLVDGLSIGAAFANNFGLGINISLAICCEEVPHELADIAILLNSGLSIKRSLCVNCLSALFGYVGLVIGVTLGTSTMEATKWVFAVAGGLFIYVPLADMFPDMSRHLDLLTLRGDNEARVVSALHTVGLLIGSGIVLTITNLSSYIVV